MSKRGELVVKRVLGLTMVSLCLSVVTPVLAQLNEHCTISILNRTAQVQPNGGWRINNVPANFGRLRARATCTENGVTRSGQSDYFTLTQNQVTGFNADMPLGAVDPHPGLSHPHSSYYHADRGGSQ